MDFYSISARFPLSGLRVARAILPVEDQSELDLEYVEWYMFAGNVGPATGGRLIKILPFEYWN